MLSIAVERSTVSPISTDENSYCDTKSKSNPLSNSYMLISYTGHKHSCIEQNIHGMVKYQHVINYPRIVSPRNSHVQEHCVMCGEQGIPIPAQNKSICKPCDSSYWCLSKHDVVVKFCKGCKNFLTLSEFDAKPEASKCGRCRQRGRANYFLKKTSSLLSSTSSDDEKDASIISNEQQSFPSTKDMKISTSYQTPTSSFRKSSHVSVVTPTCHQHSSSTTNSTSSYSMHNSSINTHSSVDGEVVDEDTPKLKSVRFFHKDMDDVVLSSSNIKKHDDYISMLKLDDIGHVGVDGMIEGGQSEWAWDPANSPLSNLATLSRTLFLHQLDHHQPAIDSIGSKSCIIETDVHVPVDDDIAENMPVCGKRSRSIFYDHM